MARVAKCAALLFVLAATGFTNTVSAQQSEDATSMYAVALGLIDSRDFTQALQVLRRIQANHPGFEKLDAVQTRIAVLHEARDAGNAMVHYLSALDKRDASDIEGAISTLEFIASQYPDSSLQDDALYLTAYIQVMDRYAFEQARETLLKLRTIHADTAYRDSAEYLDAIALEQMGRTAEARDALMHLRERHTAMSLPFGYQWPAGSVLSRYWFERADSRLRILDDVQQKASRFGVNAADDNGTLDVTVSVGGADYDLRLTPSPLTDQTAWLDGVLQDRSPPAAGVYVGKVAGDPDSWVRAVIVGNTISGALQAFGQQHSLQSGNLIGTVDYYQPRSKIARENGLVDSTSTDVVLEDDAMPAPAGAMPDFALRAKGDQADIRVVPVSVVIDSAFDRYHGGQGLTVALNQLNVADGIYRQFGIALSVDEVQVFGDNDADPIVAAPTTLETYLRSFRDYRIEQRVLFSDSALTYLFTGKERTDRTLGLAWINTLCRTDGYDVGITTPSSIGDVLLAHELGHSLGAQHDTDTSCNQNSQNLMWPNISSRTRTEFSECSRLSVAGARSKNCLRDAVNLALHVSGGLGGVQFELVNNDSGLETDASLFLETSTPGLLQWPAGCRSLTPTSGECAISRLLPGETRSLDFPVNADSVSGDPLVTGQVQPVITRDFTPSDNTVTLALVSESTTDGHLTLSNTLNGASGSTSQPAAAKKGSASWLVLFVMTVLFRRKWTVVQPLRR